MSSIRTQIRKLYEELKKNKTVYFHIINKKSDRTRIMRKYTRNKDKESNEIVVFYKVYE